MYPEKFQSISKGYAGKEYTFFFNTLTRSGLTVISEEEMDDFRILRLCKGKLVMSLVYDFSIDELYFRVDVGKVKEARKIVDHVIKKYLRD